MASFNDSKQKICFRVIQNNSQVIVHFLTRYRRTFGYRCLSGEVNYANFSRIVRSKATEKSSQILRSRKSPNITCNSPQNNQNNSSSNSQQKPTSVITHAPPATTGHDFNRIGQYTINGLLGIASRPQSLLESDIKSSKNGSISDISENHFLTAFEVISIMKCVCFRS